MENLMYMGLHSVPMMLLLGDLDSLSMSFVGPNFFFLIFVL